MLSPGALAPVPVSHFDMLWCMEHISHPGSKHPLHLTHLDLQWEWPERPLFQGCQAVLQPHVGSFPSHGIPSEIIKRAGSPAVWDVGLG